jgi:hypothetical protein
MEMTMHH